jgi:type I restriction-modification system DNA methylase subunit
MSAPKEILSLVERFGDNLEAHLSSQYNETQLRREFLDPFFKALGWDIDNEQGFAEAYKDVIHEDAIRVGGAIKAPDYCFRIGGTRKFFLEAKKPSVSIKEDADPAYQLRRYAWSAKLSLSILSDFEELAVYDCRVKPHKDDSAATARIFYCTFHEYADKWDWLTEKFSREAVLKGSFDRFAESTRAKKGTAQVDDAFLQEIEGWRKELAQHIALRNPKLTRPELNFAVQRIIDRIIFLRICEDRGIEDYGRLRTLLNGERVYPRLCQLFQQADDRYNSGLFHFKREKGRHEPPDELTLDLLVDDKPLKDILRSLYYPDSPYEFSVLSAHILGHVYEQFLGKVIRLTEGHRAVVEDKPEVKKAGGVYYTPTYIVDYIVRQTVGKLVEGKTPKQAATLRVLDPACGSGSFLIGAYQYLLDWHCDWYMKNDPAKWARGSKPTLCQVSGGGWKLTIAERKRILLNSIFGVDVDTQAVEVTKLSLLLKVLEGETEQTLQPLFRLFHERALPDLGNNIKCGNSLIGHDFTSQGELTITVEDEFDRINQFDWKRDGFPEIMEAGGFDAVIGNPPYVRIQALPRDQIDYLTSHFHSATGNCDLYISFIERGFSLLRKSGLLGFITPNKFFRTDYGEGLRRLLSDERAVTRIVNFGADQVFPATTYTCLLFLRKGGVDSFQYAEARPAPVALANACFAKQSSETLSSTPWGFASRETASLLAKIAEGTRRLLDLPAEMSRGSSTGNDEVFVFEAGTLNVEAGIVRVPLFASDFGRYSFAPTGKWKVIFPYIYDDKGYHAYTERELKSRFPRAFAHLHGNQLVLKRRKQYKEWFGYSAPRNLELHDRAQIAVPLLAHQGLFALIPDRMHDRLCPMASGGFTITLSERCELKAEYVLGLLNSKLLFWRLRMTSNLFRGGWITCTKQYFGELPIRVIDFSDRADKARHDRVVKLVEQMACLHRQVHSARTPQEKTALERQIEAIDEQIDRLIYELYGLTEDEIKIVEAPSA